MGFFGDWFGGPKSSREVRHLRFTLEPLGAADAGAESAEDESGDPSPGDIVQGQPAQFRLTVKAGSGTPIRVRHLHFDLLNRREEKRSLLERLVTQSRFVFRFNLDKDIEAGTDFSVPIEFLPPTCREGTRRTRFVTISWEVVPRLVCGEAGSANGDPTYQLVGTRFEVEIQGRR